MRAWLPYADWPFRLALPAGLSVDVYDGSGAVPSSIADVEVFVLPYLAGLAPARLMAEMPALRLAQTLETRAPDRAERVLTEQRAAAEAAIET